VRNFLFLVSGDLANPSEQSRLREETFPVLRTMKNTQDKNAGDGDAVNEEPSSKWEGERKAPDFGEAWRMNCACCSGAGKLL
jgi:hypothetical protein